MLNSRIEEDSWAHRLATRYADAMDSVDRGLRRVSLVLLGLLVGVVVLNVIMRYVFSESLLWANELSRYLMVWFALLMTAALVNSDDHLNVGIVYDRFSKTTQYRIQIAMMVLYIALGQVWVEFGTQYTLSAGMNATMPALGFQMLWVYLVIPISGALVVLFALARLVRLVVLDETTEIDTAYDVAQREGAADD